VKRLAGMLLCGALLQAQTPASVTAHLRDFALLHADFTQSRKVAALSRPMLSTGTMVMARNQGVLWQIRKPLPVAFVITPRAFLEVGQDGRPHPRPAQDAPVVAHLGRLFQALLQGQWGALESQFTVRAEGGPDQWTIRLTAKAGAPVKGAQVSGGRFLERVRVEEQGGDTLEIRFEHPRTAEPLTEAEARLLAGA